MEQVREAYTLLEKPISLDKIPVYPKYEICIAKGGEITYDIPDTCRFGDNNLVLPFEREALPGEKLREVNMKFKVDTTANKLFRGERIALANSSKTAREVEMMYCASNILYFFNVYGWTSAPRVGDVPFITYPYQDKILLWLVWMIKMNRSGLIEKSRKLGLSWMGQGLIAWLSIFHKNFVTYQFSMTEKEVDNRLEESLMGKLRLFLNSLPEWMRAGWSEYGRIEPSMQSIDKILEVQFPVTSSIVAGKLTGGQAGRSGRANLGFYDEFAFIENAEAVLAASASLCETDLYVSTVNGMGNAFARLAHSKSVLKISPHWSEHPLCDKKWAILERSSPKYYSQEIWDREMEISYQTSTVGRVYSRLKSKSMEEDEWCHIQDGPYYEYDPDYDVYVGMDFGISDPNSVVYVQEKPCPAPFDNPWHSCLIVFDEDQNRDQFDHRLAEMLLKKGYLYKLIVGDMRSGARRNSDGRSLFQNLGQYGINCTGRYNTTTMAPIKSVKKRLEFNGAFAINKRRCPILIEAMQNWSFEVDRGTGHVKSGSNPRHDDYSHINMALAYLIDYKEGGVIEKAKRRTPLLFNTNPIHHAYM